MTRTEVTASLVRSSLREQLPIPAEATTSRTLVSNQAVRVVAFAMDTGQELTDHSAPRPVVVHMLEGSMTFRLGDVPSDLLPGDVVYLAPNQRHSLIATSPCRFALIMAMAAG